MDMEKTEITLDRETKIMLLKWLKQGYIPVDEARRMFLDFELPTPNMTREEMIADIERMIESMKH